MKRIIKISAAALFITLCALVFSLSAFAVPGRPGVHDGEACKSHHGELITLSDIAKTAGRRNKGPMKAPSLTPAVNDLPLAVIVIGFSNCDYSADFDWSRAMFEDDMSLSDYYSDMSFGKFTFTPARESSSFGGENLNAADAVDDGVIHVTLDRAHDDWLLNYEYMSRKDIATSRSLIETIMTALKKADSYIDFSAYDTNSDGKISNDELAVGFVFAGYEASSSASYEHGKTMYLWSHAWSVEDANEEYDFGFELPSPDGVKVSSYIAISEKEDDGSMEPISTLAHELGHYLGLPDLYNTDYESDGQWLSYEVNYLSLMCNDCWKNPATGKVQPTPMDAWSRTVLGWLAPEACGGAGAYTVSAQNYSDNSGYDVLRIPTQNADEYYLVENRVPSKWDAPMTSLFNTEAGGLVFWHIDDAVYDLYNDSNSINNADHRPAVMPVFPEKTSAGAYAFAGKTKSVLTSSPFFDRAVWSSEYSALGKYLDLPIYASGENADSVSARTYSGIRVEFLTDACSDMKILIDPNGHAHHAVCTVIREPGCTEAGEAIFMCPLCGKLFSDESCAVEVNGPVGLSPLGHTSPDDNGECSRCGELIVGGDQLCPYCHGYHNGSFIQRIVGFFHKIAYFFTNLFN